MSKSSTRLLSLAVLLPIVTLSAHTLGAQAVPLSPSPFEGAAFSMSASDIRTAAASVPSDKISDATILYEETDYLISEKGTLHFIHRIVYRIDTNNGVRGWAEAAMDWDPWYQNPSQINARILQTDGTFATLDPKTITDSPINSDEAESYTSTRIRKAPLPGISIGSIVEEVVSVDEKQPYFPDGTVYRYPFANGAFTQREKVVVELPSSMPFRDRITDLPQLSVQRSTNGAMRRVVYEQAQRPAIIYGDIELESTSTPIPMVEFSTGTSWAAVAKGYAALSDPSIRVDQIQSILPSVKGDSRMAAIQELVKQLHKEVRYTGVEFDKAQIVPQPPEMVLKRHYGDCKDKATLLVTMLRAENIPASLALLSAGTGKDINPDLPGMDRFNHAIVYVPASGKDPALWIDATAEFNQVGNLPYEDSGRLALIIAPQTQALVKTPDPVPSDSVLIENRAFTLADLGSSHVVETSDTHGWMDATYRAWYGGPENKAATDALENYGKTAYLAKSLVKVDHGDATNLNQPFHLTLTFDDARRGFTSLNDASVAVFPSSVVYGLPAWIKTAPTPLPDNATAQQKLDRAQRQSQRSPTYNIRPYLVEERYRIVAPAGFTLRGVPADRLTPLGPASLTEHYSQESPSIAIVDFRFTTNKSVITAQEALDFRDAVAQLYKRDTVMIDFAQTGTALLAEGKIKDALAADKDAVAKNPNSALPHIWLAQALLAVGVGDMARAEADRAVALDPKSPAALITQGWVLEHDLLGNRFGSGFDRSGAIAAYTKAIPVRTEDFDPRFNLAVLDEFNANGVRYASDANLTGAIAIYRELIADDLKKNLPEVSQHRINLGYALLYNHDYSQLEKLIPDIPPGINPSALSIAVAVAQKDVSAGLASADHLNLSAEDRNKALLAAGDSLAQLGMYAQAASILSSGIQSGTDAPATARLIAMFKNMHRVPQQSPPVTTPESAVYAQLNLMVSGHPNRAQLTSLLSRHAYSNDAAFQRNLDKNLDGADFLHVVARNTLMSDIILRDVILGSTTFKTSGSDATGYRVISQTIGSAASHYFVVREDGTYRLVADNGDMAEVGNYALYALSHNQPALAKSILDWKRDLLHKGGGDDPFSGPLLPRFWTVGSVRPDADSSEAMRVAAIALLSGSMDIQPYLAQIVSARNNATGSRQTDFDLLLAKGYVGSGQPKPALRYVNSLLQQEPDSATALELASTAYSMSHDASAMKALLDPRLARRPTDPDLLRVQMSMFAAVHEFAASRKSEQSIIDSGQAVANDYNNYAWLGLFDNDLGAQITSAAQQANTLSRNSSFAYLHTLACIYAAQDKVTEARQVLSQATMAGNLGHPNSAVWYVLGLLYEDYGLPHAALAAYNRVQAHEFDDHTYVDPESAYILAQKRIAVLRSTSQNGGF
ncbi:MAG: DUF3857 domain-containing protein [Acidobacteriota bacterium]